MGALFRLSRRVVALARAKGCTVGTAESLTGGMIASALAGVPGASQVWAGGVVSYAPRIKRELLGVSQGTIDDPGVVSRPCALEMAEGARKRLQVDIAVSATGLAGPGGGTQATPVGTVFLGISSPDGTQAWEYHFTGRRQRVRRRAAKAALQLMLEALSKQSHS